jgi:hypothetical protein
MGLVLKSENLMSWSSAKVLATKSKPQVPPSLTLQAMAHNIGWFNGMYLRVISGKIEMGHHRRRAPQAKKHKTWEGDGVLVVTRPKAVLLDLEGRVYALVFFSTFLP